MKLEYLPSVDRVVSRPDRRELVAHGRETDLPTYEELGSRVTVGLRKSGAGEPPAAVSLREGPA